MNIVLWIGVYFFEHEDLPYYSQKGSQLQMKSFYMYVRRFFLPARHCSYLFHTVHRVTINIRLWN